MCRSYNTISSLTILKSHLYRSKIYDFKSLKEVIDFQSSFTIIRQQLISHHEDLIEQEKKLLNIELPQIESEIQTQTHQAEKRLTDEIDSLKHELTISLSNPARNFLDRIIKAVKHRKLKRIIKQKEEKFDIELTMATSEIVEKFHSKNNRYQFIITQPEDAVRQSVQHPLAELERKKLKIDEVNSFIYGALGEQKVVKALETLSDDYYLINDFKFSFSPAIYNRQENDYIKTVQIDHLLVGPSGVFLIETKNWNEKSLESVNVYSPVKQIRRASFALFKLLNNEVSGYYLQLDRHHWGDRKISIKNLIVLTNMKPKEEFQYVKVLTLNELSGYISYFKPVYSNLETERIANFLIKENKRS